ncbi:hypothetical protein [Shinella sp. JR1-6]|uniref:hypothetical protein n=1 Tax=Shinella sp. JR1-6 TaxID=2527671 RepID=UPI00102D541F|nr:hypothetical protein [Shinella sp. JR1-6]TAA61879.1 hypothetical protein EXZ48_12205 [Shinella sp. JR1-6]
MSYETILTYWPFTAAGFLIFLYAIFLIHRGVEIGVGHSVLVIASFLVVLAPYFSVKIGTDGSIVLERLEFLGATAQETIQGVSALQSRLESLASSTEQRLAALEKLQASTSTPPIDEQLPKLVTPDVSVPAIDDSKIIIDRLERAFPTRLDHLRF